MKASQKIIFPSALLLALVIVFYSYLHTPVFVRAKQQCVLVEPGESFSRFLRKLTQQTTPAVQLPFPILFKWYAELFGYSRQLKVGEYCFPRGTTILQLLHSVTTSGANYRRNFTIIGGQTFWQLKHKLINSPGFMPQLDQLSAKQLAYLLKLPREQFEGEFLPETYRYAYPQTDVALLREAHQLLIVTLYQAWQNRDVVHTKVYQNPYQALIAASIIEKESAISSDRRLISGVIINRLNKHMRLQMDPTVIYGLELQELAHQQIPKPIKLTRELLRQDTPYNTYRHWGLPPTPICMPSADAINAALHPTLSNYLYFVAKGNGYHQFSKTLVEQRSAIKQYLL